MIAIVMLSSMFRVRNASTMVSSGATMLYQGAACASVLGCGVDNAASAQMVVKMMTATAVLVIILIFTSSVYLLSGRKSKFLFLPAADLLSTLMSLSQAPGHR